MQRILLGVLFLIVVGTSINISASSSNINYNNLYQTSGGQPGSSTTSSGTATGSGGATVYVIVDGPGTGTQISTTTDPTTGMVVAGSSSNPATKADGHVGGIGVGEGMNCPGPLGHYHGTLNGQADPDPGNCGWGHVTELKSVSRRLGDISFAIQDEFLILVDIGKEPPDYKQALLHAHSVAADLGDLRKTIRNPMEVNIGAGKAKAISDKLGKAMKDDKSVADILTPAPTKRDTNVDTAVTIKLDKAFMAKQDAFMLLNDAEAAKAAMGK